MYTFMSAKATVRPFNTTEKDKQKYKTAIANHNKC